MKMLREFFDITQDSRPIFEGLAIMDTEYAERINSQPVVFLTLKDCTGNTLEDMRHGLIEVLFEEYRRYVLTFGDKVDQNHPYYTKFYGSWYKMESGTAELYDLSFSLRYLLTAAAVFFDKKPLLLIDEYDAPILSAFEHGYKKEMGDFFSTFYGVSLKGNEYLDRAVLTGIQRVAKESIFSRLNNLRVYTVLSDRYAGYFGLTGEETKRLLSDYDLTLSEDVKRQYNGYLFGRQEIYNPWSILNYADSGALQPYWINTSTNALIRESLAGADESFTKEYHKLLEHGSTEVSLKLETSFFELQNAQSLWGLLVNAGYLTVIKSSESGDEAVVKIPNGEVRSEFLDIVSSTGHLGDGKLSIMFRRLSKQDMEGFLELYRQMVLSSTSYHDAKENAYHMLFLGMCLSLTGLYKVTSNLESGEGRSDIRLESLTPDRVHIIIEFKQGENVAKLKEEALLQIMDKQYYAGLKGEVLCLGVAHDKKKCEIAFRRVQV
jgi:hypothetical protein